LPLILARKASERPLLQLRHLKELLHVEAVYREAETATIRIKLPSDIPASRHRPTDSRTAIQRQADRIKSLFAKFRMAIIALHFGVNTSAMPYALSMIIITKPLLSISARYNSFHVIRHFLS
jgi:hypothetical protein